MITPNYPPKVSSSAENNSLHFSVLDSKRFSDDLISDLSRQPENRRAMQVFEWEKIRRQTARANFSEFNS